MNPDNEANPGGPSSLGKLMIRGVRSFDPNRDEAIEFYSPLTMIVGANGCGKTTIIECLKFATTGLMPPGANKGQSFVNDPGMTDSVEVKASIKLRFNNAANEVCILQRSMQLTKKKVKLEFKQLDGTVKMKDHENKLTSLSYKCADLDRYIPQLLNVSPAILENVIFCHQEESSWPMLEGSVLKKKFDDILESSRYTKALDALLKLKKEYASVAKDHKAELMQAVVYLENAKTLQDEMDSTQDQADEGRREVDDFQTEIDGLDARMQKDRDELQNVRDRFSQVAELEREAEEAQRRIADRREGLDREYTESDFELNRLLNNFEEVMKDKQAELSATKREIDGCIDEMKRLREKNDKLLVTKGMAESLAKQFDDQVARYNDYGEKISRKFDVTFTRNANKEDFSQSAASGYSQAASSGISQRTGTQGGNPGKGGGSEYNRDSARTFWLALTSRVTAAQTDADCALAEYRLKLNDASKEVSKRRDQHSRHELELDSKEKAKERIMRTIDETQAQIRELGSLKSRMSQAESECEERRSKFVDFTEPRSVHSQSGGVMPGAFGGFSQIASQLSAGVSAPHPGYDAGGNYLGYGRLKEDFSTRIAHAKSRIAQLGDEYSRDASLLLQLSTRRKEIDQKQAAKDQVQADIEAERLKVSSQWSKYRFMLSPYLTAGGVGGGDGGEGGADSIPETVQTLANTMEVLDKALHQLSTTKDSCARALARSTQDIGSLEAVQQQSLAAITKLESDLRQSQANQRGGADPTAQFSGVVREFNELIDMHGKDAASDIVGRYKSKAGLVHKERRPDSDFAMPTVSAAIKVVSKARTRVYQCKFMAASSKKIEENFGVLLDSEDRQCPVCDNPIRNMNHAKASIPGIVLSDQYTAWGTDAALTKAAKKLDSLLETLQTLVLPMADSDRITSDLATAKAESQTRAQDISALKTAKESAQNDFRDAEKRHDDLARVVTRLREIHVAWDAKHNQLEDKTRELEFAQGGDAMGGRSIDDLEQLQGTRLREKEASQREKDQLTEREKEVSAHYFALKEAATEAENQLMGLQQQCSKVTTLEATLKACREEKISLDSECAAVRVEKNEVAREMQEWARDQQQAKLNLETEEETSKALLEDLRSARDEVKRHQAELDDADTKLRQTDFIALAEEADTTALMINKHEETVSTLTPRQQALSAEISQQERTRKCVRDNLDLRASEKKREQTLKLLAETRRKLGLDDEGAADGAMNVDDDGDVPAETAKDSEMRIERSLQSAEQRRGHLIQKQFRAKGRLEALAEQSSTIADKLNSANLAGIDKRHRKLSIQFETTEMAVKDLEAYYSALDKALQNYHTKSIREINKIIRELWQVIYKGQDIEMIELESGAEGTSTAATRSYNYRVVMKKGDHPLDMRGRCSAGQRVLAAIVIRLALAETFCLDCGILALDEPTTNLDDANKAGLASALAKIIVTRSQQHNFQLICITHDEDFVKLMSMELAASSDFSLPEYYFRVSREEDEDNNGRYFSHIERILWSDM